MTYDPRPHVQRRRFAMSRLRSLTTGAAIAGLAGVAGFGIVAAASWSGDPNASSSSSGGSTTSGTGSSGTGSAGQGSPHATPIPVTPPQGAGTTPRVQRGTGSGHAATGGSH